MTKTMPRYCIVCGGSAPISRISKDGNIPLCYGHEGVCSKHLKDPCPDCDAR